MKPFKTPPIVWILRAIAVLYAIAAFCFLKPLPEPSYYEQRQEMFRRQGLSTLGPSRAEVVAGKFVDFGSTAGVSVSILIIAEALAYLASLAYHSKVRAELEWARAAFVPEKTSES